MGGQSGSVPLCNEPSVAPRGARLTPCVLSTSAAKAQNSPTSQHVTPAFFFPRLHARRSTKDSTERWSSERPKLASTGSWRNWSQAHTPWPEMPDEFCLGEGSDMMFAICPPGHQPASLPRPAPRLPDQAPVGRSRRPSPSPRPRPPKCARPRTIAPRPLVAPRLSPSPPSPPRPLPAPLPFFPISSSRSTIGPLTSGPAPPDLAQSGYRVSNETCPRPFIAAAKPSVESAGRSAIFVA